MRLHHRPLFLFTAAYTAGIICSVQFGAYPVAGVMFFTLLVLLGLVAGRGQARVVLLLLAAVFAIGFLRTIVYRTVPPHDPSGYAEGKGVYLTGRVVSDPEFRDDTLGLIVRADSVETYTGRYPVEGRVMVKLYRPRHRRQEYRMPSYGEELRIRGRLEIPSGPVNPMSADYRAHLARQRVYCTLTADMGEVTVLRPPERSLASLTARFKAGVVRASETYFSPTGSKLLLGLLLGNYASLPLETQAAFMRTGTMHMLAASGYNCGIVVVLFGYLMCRLTAPRAARHILLICLLWAFTLVVGPGPSIVRAAVMISIFLGAYLLNRTPDILNSVLLACLIILAVNPLSLYDVGFQLSFGAVLAIVLMMPIAEFLTDGWLISSRTSDLHLFWRTILWGGRTTFLALLISLVATIGTWPVTAYYFNYFSTVSVIANALTALLVTAITVSGICTLLLGQIAHGLGNALSMAGTIAITYMLAIVHGLSGFAWSTLSVPSPAPVLIAVYYLALLVVLEYAASKIALKQRMAGDSRAGAAGRPDMVYRPQGS